jgi:WD40 repeat protein
MQILSIRTKERISSIAFSPDGRDIAGACGDGYVRIWDRSTGDMRQRISLEESVELCDIMYLDQNRLIVVGWDIRVWNFLSDDCKVISPERVRRRRACLSPDRQYLAAVDEMLGSDRSTSGVVLFDTRNWIQPPQLRFSGRTTGGIAFSPDGMRLASGHELNFLEYGVQLREMVSTGKITQTFGGWSHRVRRLAFSPDGRVLAGIAGFAGLAGSCLRILDVEENRELALHTRDTQHFQNLSFTVDGRYLLTVSDDETTSAWDTGSWQEHSTYTWQIGNLLNIAVSPDGLVAAAGSDSGKIVIWDLDN